MVNGSFYREFVAMRVAGRVAVVLRWYCGGIAVGYVVERVEMEKMV